MPFWAWFLIGLAVGGGFVLAVAVLALREFGKGFFNP